MSSLKIYIVLLFLVTVNAQFEASSKSHDLAIVSVPGSTTISKNAEPLVENSGSITVDKEPEVVIQDVATPQSGLFKAMNPKMSVEGDFAPYVGGKKKRNNVNINGTSTGNTRHQVPRVNNKQHPVQNFVIKKKKRLKAIEPPKPDIPIELGAEEKETDDELGSAFEDEEDNTNKIEGYKKKQKPCQKPCAAAKEDDDKDKPEPNQPDIPVELGSAIREDDQKDDDAGVGITEGKDEVVYIPFQTPRNFVVIDNDDNDDGNSDANDDVNNENISGSGNEDFSGNNRKRSVGEKDVIIQQQNVSIPLSENTDGDYDGELLQNFQKQSIVETSTQNQIIDEHVLKRKRRSPKQKNRRKVSPGKRKKKQKKKKVKWYQNSKRSDIEADRELLKTIENLNSIATKRAIPSKSEKKPIRGYIKHLAHDVRGVLNEAKTALKDTGRVIRGLRRVISGTSVLNSFTNNAVKFAKYFSMEPNNATIDFLEEKAIVSVLDAQRAANSAKAAAKLAQLAYTKTQEVEKRMEVASKGHKNVENGLKYVNTAKKQAARAEKAARLASNYKDKTEKDVMVMDLELRKMGAQLEAENNNIDVPASIKNITSPRSVGDKVKVSFKNQSHPKNQSKLKETSEIEPTPLTSSTQMNNMYSDSEDSPDVKLLLPKAYKESVEQQPIAEEPEDTFDNKTIKQQYANYFYMKQKQLEHQLTNDTVPTDKKTKLNGKKYSVPSTKSVKVIDMIPPTETEEVKRPDDQLELEYIASLNKKIANIKKEEEDATQRLRAVELARTFAATKSHPVEDPDPLKTSEENANVRTVDELASELSNDAPSLLKTNIPVSTDQYTAYRHHQTATHETAISDAATVAKKRTKIHKKSKESRPHIYPGEYTGFKKQMIAVVDGSRDQTRENKDESPQSVAKSEVLSPKNHAQPIAKEDIGDALSDAENTVVAEDNDFARKRERIESEAKFRNNASKDNDDDDNNSGSGEESGDSLVSNASKKSEVALVKKIEHGPASVAAMVNRHKLRKRNETESKKEDLIDPFGFTPNTNEGSISDRTIIPNPEYLTTDYKRSEVPKPIGMISKYTQADVVNDNKK